jgi:hypothetical protein
MINQKYLTRSGKKHWAYKGGRAGYVALHEYISQRLGIANLCEQCKRKTVPKNRKTWFEWSCKVKPYTRNLKDWWQLCIPCHRKYDGWDKMISDRNKGQTWWKLRERNALGHFI